MSSPTDTSKEAIALRTAAKEFWQPTLTEDQKREEERDPDDRAGRLRWRNLSRAAVNYARLVLAGQCIPELPKPKRLEVKWHTCSHGPPLPPGARCSLCED
ncbi:MAG: hypothetical protein EPN91_08645 [Salinibacterium sp.]|nr:MAG: hypothetical protein EPN91_08645 [Salinibacterium sp.]